MECFATLLLCLISLCNIGSLVSEPVRAVAFSSAHSSFASAAASASAGGACFEEPDNDYDTPAPSYNDDCTQKDPESEEYYCPPQQPTAPRRVCTSARGLRCARAYVRRHAACRTPTRAAADEYNVGTIMNYLPFSNSTSLQRNLRVSGFRSGRVEGLVVDEKTQTTVLTTSITGLYLSSDIEFRYYRPNHLPKIIVSPGTEYYAQPVYFTTVFDGVDNLQLENSYTQAYISQIGNVTMPCLSNNDDPVVEKYYDALTKDPAHPATPELFTSRARLFSAIYIQNFICDFGAPYDAFKLQFG